MIDMTPMQEAWRVLKTEFLFENAPREQTMPAGLVTHSFSPDWLSNIESNPAEAEINLGHSKFPQEVEKITGGEFQTPEYPYDREGVINSYWKNYDKKFDPALIDSMTDLLRHESVHETLNNVPEMRQALAHAVSEAKKGNLEPYKQWLVVHETMANFQPPDFKGEKENVKNYIWNHPKFSHSELYEEAQKVKQGGWKGGE